ncbi:hypothetical protein DEM27_04520 [Metarhizobium album]|uniref:Uncharacterized protein n=1 Tax=Metarhizobium album TaxID=2182425 RepID=A0A2U2DUC0_9HYPH|nr:hypothetical protein [Rhizobium album]PWE56913.1 hypothetical protein DEM27_04520 [Rhizobium album]
MSSWKKAGFAGSRWRLFRRLARSLIGSSESIDVEMMPDAWKRDVGLLDGREPRMPPQDRCWPF